MEKKWIKDLTSNEVIHAPTFKIAEKLQKFDNDIDLKDWDYYKENTCYDIVDGFYEAIDLYKKYNRTIYTIDDFLDFQEEKIFTYEDFKAGKFAFENDGTVEELREVTKINILKGASTYYWSSDNKENFDCSNYEPDLPIVKVTEFLKKTPKLEEKSLTEKELIAIIEKNGQDYKTDEAVNLIQELFTKEIEEEKIEVERYKVESWVCDSGIWDNQKNEFIVNPFHSENNANIICNYLNSLTNPLK
jgi:hypothetical protein